MTETAAGSETGNGAAQESGGDDVRGAATPPEPSETFDREYVQKLRDEAAGHRVKASAPTPSTLVWRPHRPP